LENEIEDRIIRALAELPLDYLEQKSFIQDEKKRGVKWAMAGVLVLLGEYPTLRNSENRYFFLLNKRSAKVQQPGDLCFPGGHHNRWIDLVSSHLIIPYILPLRKSKGFKTQKRANSKSFQTILYFLGNALREGFEEIRLNPFKVDFLGPLRAYRLEQLHRVVFPIVGVIKDEINLKANWEVEKILRTPLASLLNHDNYATYKLKMKGEFRKLFNNDWVDHDCFIHHEDGQPNEILWGATYKIVMAFLKVIFDFDPPESNIRPIIEGEIYPHVS